MQIPFSPLGSIKRTFRLVDVISPNGVHSDLFHASPSKPNTRKEFKCRKTTWDLYDVVFHQIAPPLRYVHHTLYLSVSFAAPLCDTESVTVDEQDIGKHAKLA